MGLNYTCDISHFFQVLSPDSPTSKRLLNILFDKKKAKHSATHFIQKSSRYNLPKITQEAKKKQNILKDHDLPSDDNNTQNFK